MNFDHLSKYRKSPFLEPLEKRLHRRKSVVLEAKVISRGFSYAAFVGDISERGLYMITSPVGVVKDSNTGIKNTVTFLNSSREGVSLQFRAIWSDDVSPHGLTQRVGVEIIDPSSVFKKFFHSF
jgi:hypothetical protein